jgi:hypothetical protein
MRASLVVMGHPFLENCPQVSLIQCNQEKIAARCREMQDPANPESKLYTRSIGYTDPSLDNLVASEQQRQKTEIVQSIDRVCELIQAERTRLIAKAHKPTNGSVDDDAANPTSCSKYSGARDETRSHRVRIRPAEQARIAGGIQGT